MEASEDENEEKDMVSDGPLSVLMHSVKTGSQALISLRNNHKLLARIKAFDRHCNMVLEDVLEMWTESTKKGQGLAKERKISKLFLRGDCVVLVVKNPQAA